jgi:hypothetical protein
MKLPPDVQFHQDIGLLVYRPRGLIDEAAINKVVSVIEDIETATQEPFNRFSDTSATHEVELNFNYVIQVALHRRLSYKGSRPGEVSDSRHRFHSCSLRPVTRLTD